MFDLKGKVAIVTGGNGGIGLGMARGLAQAGARVVVSGRNAQKSEAAVRELTGLGAEACAIAADVTDAGAVARLVQGTLDRYGRLDVLVNNAGTNIRKPVQDLALDEWHTVLDTNLTSAFLCSKAAYPAFKTAVDNSIKGMIKSGDLAKLYDKWFMQPIPPGNTRVNLPPSDATKAAWANPTDKPLEEYAQP